MGGGSGEALTYVRGPEAGAEVEEEARREARAGPAEPAPERYPFWNYADLFLFCGLTVPSSLFAWAAVRLFFSLTHIRNAPPAAEPLAEQLILYLMLFAGLSAIFRIEYGRPLWRSLGWDRLRLPFVWIVVAGAAAAYLVAILG
ncbi:MAG TPA: hypothetical protein VMU19_15630, partial [Bryobacteraceae bacterium]|nr:hypothetical protein [Bryobacteraceae bacterium]